VRWVCRECGCLYTPGAPCCPACRATAHDEEGAVPAAGQEDEVPKIGRFGAVTVGSVTTGHASAILPDGAQVHPGSGEPMPSVEHPADGTMSPPVSNEAPEGEAPAVPVAEPAPAPPSAPKSDPGPPKAAAKATPPPPPAKPVPPAAPKKAP
jgi:hypothetical protein